MDLSEIGITVLFLLGIAVLLLLRVFTRRKGELPPRLSALLLLVLLGAVAISGVLTLGTGAFLTLFLLGVCIAGAVESLALRTGMVGSYAYSSRLGVAWFGVPLAVMVMWGAVTVAVYWSALSITGFMAGVDAGSVVSWQSRLLLSLNAALMATVFDLVLDPVMVRGGFWRWNHKGGWYDVPAANYAGWFITTLAIFLIFSFIRNPFMPLIAGRTGMGLVLPLSLMLPVMLLDLGWTAFSRGMRGAGWVGMISGAVTGWLAFRVWW